MSQLPMNDFVCEIYQSIFNKQSILYLISEINKDSECDMWYLSHNQMGDSMDFLDFKDISETPDDEIYNKTERGMHHISSKNNKLKLKYLSSINANELHNPLIESIQVSYYGLDYISKYNDIELAKEIYKIITNKPRY